jgi:CHASE2 domain-containing sensor protein
VAAACWLILASLHLAGAFRVADLKLRDVRYQLRGQRQADDRIALVTIDDATVRAYGRWPLPRAQYALLLGALQEGGARGIGVDLLLLDEREASDDSLLAAVTAACGPVIHSFVFPPRDPESRGETGIGEAEEVLLRRNGIEAGELPVWQATEVALPYPALLRATRALGHVTVLVDGDGPVRRVPVFVRYRDRVYPSLSLRMATMVRCRGRLPELRPHGSDVVMKWNEGESTILPVDDEGGTGIDFAGDVAAFPHRWSMIDVARWYQAGQDSLLRRAFADRIVLVGNTAVGEAAADIGTTPFSNRTPLVYVHANALDALLGDRFLTHPPLPLFLLAWGVVAVALGLLVMVRPLLHAALSALGVTIAWQGIAFAALALFRIDMPSLLPAALPFAVYAAVGSFRLLHSELQSARRDRELRLARDIQRNLLPRQAPEVEGLDVYGTNLPAQEVGGDYYDWIVPGDGRLLVALGDVSGKGVSASLLMSHVRASLHAEARGMSTPSAIVTHMHRALHRAVEPGLFATFFLGVIDPGRNELSYCNGGHNPPLLWRDGESELLPATGLPLGMVDIDNYGEGTASFRPGDYLVLFSDGVTEAPRGGEFYGEDRLTRLVEDRARAGASAREMGEAILDDVGQFARRGNDWDDVTLLVVRRLEIGAGVEHSGA